MITTLPKSQKLKKRENTKKIKNSDVVSLTSIASQNGYSNSKW
jgi:hypothetical protein